MSKNKDRDFLESLTPEQIAPIFKRVFESRDGQLALEYLRMGAHVYKPSFEEENCNPNLAIFNEGKRAVVITIETMLALPALTAAPIQEAQQ